MAACHFDQIAVLIHDFGLGMGGFDPSFNSFPESGCTELGLRIRLV
jgi:hypothetical protein